MLGLLLGCIGRRFVKGFVSFLGRGSRIKSAVEVADGLRQIKWLLWIKTAHEFNTPPHSGEVLRPEAVKSPGLTR